MSAIDLRSLLRAPPADIADVFATSLLDFNAAPGAPRSGSVPLQQLLMQAKDMRPEEKGVLMKKLVEGMSALEPQKQAQIVSMGIKVQKMASYSSRGGHAADGAPPPSPEVQRIVQLAGEAMQGVRPSDLQQVGQVAQQTLMTTAQDPAKLVRIAKDLPPEDRADLNDILSETNIVPPQHKALVGRALERDGPLDKLGVVLDVLEKLKPFAMHLLAVPVVEWLLGLLFSLLWCEAPFANWLLQDGFGMVVTIAAFFGLYHFAESLKSIGMQVMSEGPGSDVEALLNHPSLTPEKKGVVALCFLFLIIGLLGVLCQVLWSIWGVLLILDFAGCNFLVSLLSKIAMVVKAVVLLGLIYQIAISFKRLFGGFAGLVPSSTATQYQRAPVGNQFASHPE